MIVSTWKLLKEHKIENKLNHFRRLCEKYNKNILREKNSKQ